MTEMGSARTLGDLLASRRQRRFVGRASEIELFRLALDSAEPLFSMLHVHGPAGIGKTRLLDVFAGLAADAGASIVRVDGRDLVPSPPVLLEALREVLEVPDGEGAIVGPSGGRLVVLVDTYERLGPLDDWVRTGLLPRLPATALTVVAGRRPPDSAWRADPAWRELLRVVSLRNLSPEESRQYLHACGVDPARHGQLVEVAHGHPLGLSLLADVVVRGGEAAADPLTPDLVGTLLRQFLEVVPSGLHRRALEVCAVARVTTEALLREVLGLEDAHELFAWLRELSFVESGPEGTFPHDLARDALEADLRWRDPDGYKRVFRGVRAHIHGRLKSSQGHEQQGAIFDAKFLFRRLPSIVSPVDWDAWGRHYPEPARPGDREPILDLVLGWEGEASAAIAARWWERQPEGFFVVRGRDGAVGGFLALMDLTRASSQDIAADPGARAAWDYARRHAPPRPGELVTQSRFIIDREAYQGPSPTLNATPILTMQRYLQTPKLAWDFLTLAEPERWDDYFAAADLPRVAGADFWVAGRRYGLFAHDFRQVPVDALEAARIGWMGRGIVRQAQASGS
jgi:AAA ATPase domain